MIRSLYLMSFKPLISRLYYSVRIDGVEEYRIETFIEAIDESVVAEGGRESIGEFKNERIFGFHRRPWEQLSINRYRMRVLGRDQEPRSVRRRA